MSLLIISGFEANGFAGLLKDTRVANSFQVPASAISTCQTAQSRNALKQVTPTSLSVLKAQLSSLSVQPSVIKIGVIPTVEIATCLAQFIDGLTEKPFVVLDPVETSSGDGQSFSSQTLGKCLRPLIPYVNLITPNQPELASLNSSGIIENSRNPRCEHSKAYILLKGGHAIESTDSHVTDHLFDEEGENIAHWQQAKLATTARGTGCFLSTAVACGITLNYNLLDAITLANAALHTSLKTQQPSLGLPKKLELYATVAAKEELTSPSAPFSTMQKTDGLYPVVDSAHWVETLAATGIHTIQLRVKNATPEALKNEIREAIAIAQRHNLQLFINDYWELAIELGAYGVHLGQEDLETADLAAIQRAGLRLGISTHGDFELKRAIQLQPTYLAVGAIFPTQTKDMSVQLQGIERLTRYVKLANGIPVVAIGGINESNLNDVICTDANMVAMVSAITQATEPATTAERFHQKILKRSHSLSLVV